MDRKRERVHNLEFKRIKCYHGQQNIAREPVRRLFSWLPQSCPWACTSPEEDCHRQEEVSF